MKVKVIKEYVDKNTREHCKIDSVQEYEEERAKELMVKGFVKSLEKKEEKTEEEPNDNQTKTKTKPKKK